MSIRDRLPGIDAVDITDILTDTLIKLEILSDVQEPPRSFYQFSLLPTELRLKIYKQSLSSPSTVNLRAKVVLSDPSFGLYLSFKWLPPPIHRTLSQLGSKPKAESVSGSRVMPLLSVCRESREFYLSQYPIALPSDTHGEGKIRLSPLETVHLSNFDELLKQEAFRRAIDSSTPYRLQDCLASLELVAISITCFLSRTNQGMNCNFVRMFKNLKGLKAIMWPGYEDIVDEAVRRSMWFSMERPLKTMGDELNQYMEEGHPMYQVPRLEIQLNSV